MWPYLLINGINTVGARDLDPRFTDPGARSRLGPNITRQSFLTEYLSVF